MASTATRPSGSSSENQSLLRIPPEELERIRRTLTGPGAGAIECVDQKLHPLQQRDVELFSGPGRGAF